MTRIHDLGGMYGFGEIPTSGETFETDWERTVFGMVIALGTQSMYNLSQARHAVERLPPARYLSDSYFERWLDARLLLLAEAGAIDGADLASLPDRTDDSPDDSTLDAETRAALLQAVEDRIASDTDATEEATDPAFDAGDSVRVRSRQPEGHTRCPGYVRRARGTVHAVRGTQVYPDDEARGVERREPLYTVEFQATELWGEDAHPGDTVSVDLWEPYLEPAD